MKGTKILRTRLSNGIRVFYLHTPSDPISACHLFLPQGSAFDPNAMGGLSTLSWSLFTKGTQQRSARQLAEEVESMGASMGAGASHDFSEVSCHAVSVDFVRTLTIMSDALLNPAFAEEEIEKERASLLAGIRAKKDSLSTIASEHLNGALYGAHPYGRPSSGTEQTVAALKRSHLLQWHRKRVRPSGAVLCVASDIPPKQLIGDLEHLFGKRVWPNTQVPAGSFAATKPLQRKKHLQFREKFEQAFLVLGYPAPAVSHRDYLALKIFNAVLGGGMSTRLFQRLREEQGLAYDVGSYYASKKAGSAFVIYMGLQAANVNRALQGIHDLIRETLDVPLPKQEVQDVKNYMTGTHVLDHQTNSQRARYLGWWSILGINPEFDATYPNLIQKTSAQRVQDVARRVLNQPSVTVEITPC